MKKIRNEKSEMPGNFSEYLNTWSLESVSTIVLERRLNLLSGNSQDDRAKEFIKVIRNFFILSAEFESAVPVWKYYETKRFKQLMEVYDAITK